MIMQQPFNDNIGIPEIVTEFYGLDTLGRNSRVHPTFQIRRGPSYGGRGIFVGEEVVFFGYTMLILGSPESLPLANIRIGNGVYINMSAYISGEGGLVFEDYSLIGANSNIVTAGHGIHDGDPLILKNPLTYGPVHVGKGAWIGAGATLIDGVTVGEGAVVGAGSVLTSDVEPYSVYVGSPARFKHYRRGHEPKSFDRKRWWRFW
jgi:galactoside O-acetyltransferase